MDVVAGLRIWSSPRELPSAAATLRVIGLHAFGQQDNFGGRSVQQEKLDHFANGFLLNGRTGGQPARYALQEEKTISNRPNLLLKQPDPHPRCFLSEACDSN